jgi:hypothetical protein
VLADLDKAASTGSCRITIKKCGRIGGRIAINRLPA